jgi:adenosine kinase
MNVVVTGSLAFDYIMDFPGTFKDHIDPTKLHILNISFLVETLKKLRGGTAGNIAYNLALLKVKNLVLASVGEDFSDYEIFLEEAGVDTSQIKIIEDELTAQAKIITDKDDNQITAFYTGAMKYSSSLNIPDASFCVIAPNDPEAMEKYVLECKSKKIPYLFDPGMQLPRLSDHQIKEGIEGAEILIGNDYEIGIILKRLNTTEKELSKLSKIVITTLGKDGSKVLIAERETKVETAKVQNVLDPTGAGDAYRAGFLAGFLRGLKLEICAKMGSVAASFAIEQYGTTNHAFSLKDFSKRYKESFNENLELH